MDLLQIVDVKLEKNIIHIQPHKAMAEERCLEDGLIQMEPGGTLLVHNPIVISMMNAK